MQTTLALYNLLQYTGSTGKIVKLYLRPLGLRSTIGSSVDDGKYTVTGYRLDQEKRQPAEIVVDGWTDSFWRMMEEAGYRVADKRRIARGEVLWTLTPMEQACKKASVPGRTNLLVYVEKVRPLAGARAQRALEIATAGKVHKVLTSPDGNDCWKVESSQNGRYTVSIAGKSCTCPDAANGAPRWMDGPLCKHRLAVMYITRWEEDQERAYQQETQLKAEGDSASDEYPAVVEDDVPAPPYVTVRPPQTSKDGWRWVTVMPHGKLNRSSQREYPDALEAMNVARIIANSYGYPLYLDGVQTNGTNDKRG